MRRIELVFKGTDLRVTAVLLEKEAPQTCDAVWAALPLENEMVHSAWSGESIVAHPCGVNMTPDSPPENKTIFVGPGELGLEPGVDELMVFYGRGEPRWRMGPVPLSVFGRIIEGLEEFADHCKRMPREGSKIVVIRRKG